MSLHTGHTDLLRNNPGIICSQVQCLTSLFGHKFILVKQSYQGKMHQLLRLTTWSLPFQAQGCVDSLEKSVWAQQLCHVTLFILKSAWHFGHSKKPEGPRMIINKSRVTSWRWAVLGKALKTRSKSLNTTLQQVSCSASSKRIVNWSQDFQNSH